DAGNLLLLGNLGYEALQVRLFDPQGTPVGPPLDVNTDDTIIPLGGNVAWTGDSWLTAWVAAIPPYDQVSIYVRRFAKRKAGRTLENRYGTFRRPIPDPVCRHLLHDVRHVDGTERTDAFQPGQHAVHRVRARLPGRCQE